MLLKAPDMLCVRSDENLPTRWVPVFLGMLDLRALSASVVWWRRRLKVSTADLPVTAPNWIGATAPVSSDAFPILFIMMCSNIFRDIVKCEMGSHYFTFVGSQLGLRILTYVVCFQAFRKWRSWSDEL